jgi:hypothetical protein
VKNRISSSRPMSGNDRSRSELVIGEQPLSPAVTMAMYTEAPSEATRDALRKLSDWLV